MPEVLLQASRLLPAHQELRQSCSKQSDELRACQQECLSLRRSISSLSKDCLAKGEQLSAVEKAKNDCIQALKVIVEDLENRQKHLEEQLRRKTAQLRQVTGQIRSMEQPSGYRESPQTAEEPRKESSEELQGQRNETENTEGATERPFGHASQAASMTVSQRRRFNAQFDYSIASRLQPFFHKPFLSAADLDAMKTQQSRLAGGSGVPQGSATAFEDQICSDSAGDSTETETVPASSSPCPARSKTEVALKAPLLNKPGTHGQDSMVPDSFPPKDTRTAAHAGQPRRQSARLQGRMPSYDGAVIAKGERSIRTPLAPLKDVNARQPRKRQADASGTGKASKRRTKK